MPNPLSEQLCYNRYQIRKILSDEDKLHLFPDEHEINIIKGISDVLEIIEAGTRDLCGRKETLASADRV